MLLSSERSSKIRLFLIVCLFFHISCKCTNPPVTEAIDDCDIELTTEQIQVVGSVNNIPVVRVTGKITKNIKDQEELVLGALFVPSDSQVQTAVKSLIESKKAWEPEHYTILSDGSFAYYANKTTPGQQGSIIVPVHYTTAGLKAGKSYVVHLFLRNKEQIFYNNQGKILQPLKPFADMQLFTQNGGFSLAQDNNTVNYQFDGEIVHNGMKAHPPAQAGVLFVSQYHHTFSERWAIRTAVLENILLAGKTLPFAGPAYDQVVGNAKEIFFLVHPTAVSGNDGDKTVTIIGSKPLDQFVSINGGLSYEGWFYIRQENHFAISD